MKTASTLKTWLTLPLLAVAFGAGFSANAQTEPLGPPARPRAAGEPARFQRPGPGGVMAGRSLPGLERLQSVLTEEQRTSLRAALEGQRDKIRNLDEQLRTARRELFEAGLAVDFNEDTLREKAAAAAKLDAEVMVLRAKAVSQMRPRLTPEQIKKLKNAPDPAAGGARPERLDRRPQGQRDEHDLPVKPKSAAE